jgi:hypothetical protein
MRKNKSTPMALLPVKRFAKRLGISVWTARAMAYRKEVASCKIGVKLLIPAEEVTRLIRENLRPASDPPANEANCTPVKNR